MTQLKHPKQKGSVFERKVAKALTDWSGYEFHRTPMSGALHWENDARVVSDIVPPESLSGWPFSIECKNVECSWDIDSFIRGTATTISSHWVQASNDADAEGLVPLLVFTKNYHDSYVMMRSDTYDVLSRYGTLVSGWARVRLGDSSYLITSMSGFLESYTCEQVIDAFRK